LLYLFYDAVEQPWGFDEDAGCFKVLYFDGDMTELKRKEYPEQSQDFYPLPAFKVEFENMYTISEQPDSSNRLGRRRPGGSVGRFGLIVFLYSERRIAEPSI
jgi:uncharacterized protein YwqG